MYVKLGGCRSWRPGYLLEQTSCNIDCRRSPCWNFEACGILLPWSARSFSVRVAKETANVKFNTLMEPRVYKNLNCDLLGISGRQSEIIELALTYGFRGIDIDICDLVKRCERGSFESAARFLTSSKLKIGGFQVPIDLDADDDNFAKDFEALEKVAEIAGRAEAKVAVLDIPSQTDRLPYPEFFEVIRKRINDVAAVFGKEDVRTALAFNPIKTEDEKEFKFIQNAEGFVALANTCTNAGIVLDAWTWFCGGGTEELCNQIATDRILAVRVGDCVEGVSPDAATMDDCLLPGSSGVIDCPSYLRKCIEQDLEISVSARGRLAQTGGTRDAFIGKTQDSLDKILRDAGLPGQAQNPDEVAETSAASN